MRGDVHDGTTVLLHPPVPGELSQPQRYLLVQHDDLIHGGRRHIDERCGRVGHAGVVDENVQGTEVADAAVDGALARHGIGNRAGDTDHSTTAGTECSHGLVDAFDSTGDNTNRSAGDDE